MIRTIILSAVLAFLYVPFAAQAADAPTAPAPAHAFFANIKNGDTVTSPVKVVFGITGMEIAPAATPQVGTAPAAADVPAAPMECLLRPLVAPTQ